MFSVQEGTLNISLKKPELDHFIDAAFLLFMFVLFTFDYAELGLSYLYYGAYFLFVGFSAVKIIARIMLDGKVMLSGITIWYILFSLFSLCTALWSDYPDRVLDVVVRRIQIILLLFCLSQTYATRKGAERCFKLISWAASFCVIYVFSQTEFSDWFTVRFGETVTLLNTNVMGMALTVTTLITLYFAYYEKQRLYYVFFAIQCLATVLTGSRKSVIAVFIGFALLVFLKDKSIKLLLRVVLVILSLVAAVYAIMNVPELYKLIGRRFETMLGYLRETDYDNSMYLRELFIDYAKQFFTKHPLLGNGDASFSRMIEKVIDRNAYAHNNYYEVLTDFGLVGFIMYYSMYVYMIIKLIRMVFFDGNNGAKLMLTIMTVVLICEYGIVLYYSVYAMIFLAAIFFYICAADNANSSLLKNNRQIEQDTAERKI